MRGILVALVCLTISFPAFAKPAIKSDSIAKGVSVAVYVHPSASTRSSPDKAIQQAFNEGRRLFKDPDFKNSPLLLRVLQQISQWTKGLFKPDAGKVKNGYVIDRMAGVLKSHGYTDFMIQSGPITRTMGRDGSGYWLLNIPDVHGSQSGLCRVSLGGLGESSSVATVDTRSIGMPAKTDLRSVTVITKNATNASALARTAFLAGQSQAREIFTPLRGQGFGVILEDTNGKIQTIGDVTAACFEE